ncbi:histidine kinase [Streptomyces gelaticus]|uniref:histidine kinase n=1 Tax=Streptomyces gelaticus TaxID=285446 RepID=UPI0016787ECB|nr:histidine kinase [Streptomyces gelaticus]
MSRITWSRTGGPPGWRVLLLPVLALASTLVVVPFGTAAIAGAVAAPVAALIALHALAVHRTAGPALAGAATATTVASGTAAALGEPPHYVAGVALVTGGAVAVAFATGRSRRRRRAHRSALVAYRAGTSAVPRFAALAERDRLAAELHDVAAHRLTGIVVSAGAALRLNDQERTAEALRHAIDAGRQAVRELDRLTGPGERAAVAGLADIDALAAEHGVDYRRTVDAAPGSSTEAAYRVVREALTNAARYAHGAAVRVHVERGGKSGGVEQIAMSGGPDRTGGGPGLTVTITDDGGTVAVPGLGTGHGIAGLRAAVRTAGGTLSAGPEGSGWTVRAQLPPAASPAVRRRPGWRGPIALDWALVVLAIALSLGASLLSADVPDSFRGFLPAVPTVLLSGLHAVPLGWRSRAPGRGLAAVLLALVLWLACDLAGWTQPPVSDIFLVYWWVELTLAHGCGAYLTSRHSHLAPLAVAAVGGVALASGSGITGNRAAAWAVLTGMLAFPAFAAWSLGRFTARRRERLRAAAARQRKLLDRDADAAVRDQRRRIAAGLRRTAHRHARAVVAAAEAGHLETVRTEARAGLAALRELLTELRDRDGGDAPPPTVAGIAALATRYGTAVRYTGSRRPAPAVVEVAAYRVAATLMAAGVTLTVRSLDDGVELSGPAPADPGVLRRLRVMADATGGTLSTSGRDAVRVWLPEVSPSRSE